MENYHTLNEFSWQYEMESQDPLVGTVPITPTAASLSSTQPQYIWNFSPEEMASFSISPLDLQDSAPSNLYSFNSCSISPTNSANNYSCKNGMGCFFSKQSSLSDTKQEPHDMADVLLSLKHTVVYPGQLSPTSSPFSCYQSSPQYPFPTGPTASASASLSCTVYPYQMTPLPIESDYNDITDQQYSQYNIPYPEKKPETGNISPTSCVPNTFSWTTNHPHHQTLFPTTMSVNVSMNMTMHGYPTPTTPPPLGMDMIQSQLPCHQQFQWTTLTPNSSPIYQSVSMISPTHNAYCNSPSTPTYSIGSDFKTEQISESFLGATTNSQSPFKPYNNKICINQSANSAPCMAVVAKRSSKCIFSIEGDIEKTKLNLCKICGKSYARPSTLKTHLRTHSGEKPYRCEDCNKSFSQAANLTAHVRTHSGEKPFRCPICGRTFSQSSSVTTHIRTHSGERPYRCRLCRKAFSDSSTLTKHSRIHSGEKPYQCKLCQLRFSQSGNLNRHMRVHTSLEAKSILS